MFALHALSRREEAWGYLQKALQKYPDDPAGTLRGMQALMLAESEPGKAQVLIDSVRQRKAANPSHHAPHIAARASARLRNASETVQWLKEAARTSFPCYSLFARDPNLDPVRSDPIFRAFMTYMQKHSRSSRRRCLVIRRDFRVPASRTEYHLLVIGQYPVARIDATATTLRAVPTATDGKVGHSTEARFFAPIQLQIYQLVGRTWHHNLSLSE